MVECSQVECIETTVFFYREEFHEDKLALPGDDFTYTFDITNESDKKISFYVYSEWSDTKDPDVFYEIKVPAKSKNIYTYTVSKDMYDKYDFGYVYNDEKERKRHGIINDFADWESVE